MPMKTAKIFSNGRSLAVRIPRDWLGDAKEVELEHDGDTIHIRPRRTTLGELAKRCAKRPVKLDRLPQSTTPPPSIGG